MPEILWDPGKAGQTGNVQGQMIGYTAGLYSVPGMANIAAAPTEVLNQNGYSVYQDTDTGRMRLAYDNHTDNGSIWNSQSLGVTVDCSGDTVFIKGINSQDEEQKNDGQVQAALNSFGLMTVPNYNYSGYTSDARNSFALTSQNILNRLNASQGSGVSYYSTAGLNADETIDPVTHAVVDKEKSAAIDELTTSEATKHKFDNIAKLIKKVSEKQHKAETVAQDKSGDYAVAAGVAVGAAGALAGAGKGGAIGAAIGSIIPGAGTAVGAVIGAIGGAIVGAAAGFGVGKAVNAYDESKAETANNEAALEAQEAGENLKDALEGLSEEELIAFQRYYYEQTGVKITDVLKSLETDDDSSKIAQGAGFDAGYLSGVFADIDDANETLKPDETDTSVTGSPSGETANISGAEQAQLDVLQQNMNILKGYWQAALANGGSIVMNGETKTADELAQMYVEAAQKLDEYKQSLSMIEI